MAIADTITTLGNNIVSLIATRANKDLSNLSDTGEAKLVASSRTVPVGTVIAYMGTTVPDGYLLMDGREVSKTTYADLYAVIGDTQGTATDSTNFVIADMTDGRYLMGSTVAGGSQSQTLPNIQGGYGRVIIGRENNRADNAFKNSTTVKSALIINSGKDQGYAYLYFNASLYSSVYQENANVCPLSIKCMWCIRY